MIEQQINGLTAAKLRIVLFSAIFLLLAIGGGAFWLLRNSLAEFANDVQVAKVKASVSDADIAQLQHIKETLEEDQVAVERAKNIVADSQTYQYQDQIVNDINAYAKRAGIVVTGFAFSSGSDSGDSSSSSSSASTSASTEPGSSTPIEGAEMADPTEGVSAAPELKTTSVTVSIQSPVDYKAIMRFIHSLELNLTKMQLSGISLTKASDGEGSSPSQVAANALTIEVYMK